MAAPTQAMIDAMIHGIGIESLLGDLAKEHIPLRDFYILPEPGERDPWPGKIWLGHDFFDDGGGPAIAAYRWGLCATHPSTHSR